MLVKQCHFILKYTWRAWSLSSRTLSLHSQRCADIRTSFIPKMPSGIYHNRGIPILLTVRQIGSRGGELDKDVKKKVDLPYPEQKVTVYACEDIYERWRKEKKFRRVPKSGVFADICYVDTLVTKDGKNKTIDASAPTVLCIHGIPGNYGVFSHLISHLGRNGVRVIVPTFPDTLDLPGKYGTELFRHSAEEKTEVFKSFLKALNVTRLDAVVSHSSAIYPALRLTFDPDLKVKCQVLFNTGGHKKTVTMRPFWILWATAHVYFVPAARDFGQTCAKFAMKYIMRTPIKKDNMHGIAILATTMVFSEYYKTKEQFEEVAKKQIPTLLCFSEDDKVVERELTYEVISLLGASSENITYYDTECNVKSTGNQKSWLKLISFEAGSHYVFRKHPDVCNQAVMELLRSVENKDKT